MNNRVLVVSKPEFNNMMSAAEVSDNNVEEKLKKYALISINDTFGPWSVSWFDKNHSNVLLLWFDDVERDGERSPTNKEPGRAFNEDQVQSLIDFIDDNMDKDFIVHCTAGISRSGAVGRFINDILGGDKEKFLRTNSRICPNGRVSRMLNEYYWKKRFKEAKKEE